MLSVKARNDLIGYFIPIYVNDYKSLHVSVKQE